MRTLPQHPSLVHLKQQAKDLLHAMRERSPHASLSVAQRTLAQQYGFRTWNDLRAEVDRRRSGAEPADAQLASAIAEAFGLGDVTGSAILAHEVQGPEIGLETSSGSWFAHAVLPWVDDEQAEESVRLMEAARAAGMQVHRPVRTPDGRLVAPAGDLRWRVDHQMDLGPAPARPVAKASARAVGGLLAMLHGLGLQASRPMNPWLTSRRTAEKWNEVLAFVQACGAEWAGALERALPAIVDVGTLGADVPEGEIVLSHTNLVPANLRSVGGGSLVAVAWEFAGAIPSTWELGGVLHSWTEGTGEQIDTSAASEIVAAYSEAAGREPVLDLSIFTMAVTAWLNWLASRIGHALGDGEMREKATKELKSMLAFPLSRQSLQRVLAAAGG